MSFWDRDLRDEEGRPQILADSGFVGHTFRKALAGTFPDRRVPELGDGLRLCLGAGNTAPSDWLCLDSWEAYPESDEADAVALAYGTGRMRADVRDLSFLDSGTASAVYSHHVLEHIPIRDWDRTLAEWSRVLRPGGLMYMTCPDLEAVAAAALEGASPGSAEAWYASHPRQCLPGWRPSLNPVGFRRQTAWGVLYMGGEHLAVPTEAQYRAVVEPLGFEVRRHYNDLTTCGAESRTLASLELKTVAVKL